MPRCGATGDENYSPPPEGCRRGLWRTGGPTLKATPSAPPRRGFSREVSFSLFLEWDFWLADETEGFKVSIKGKGFGQ